MIRVVLADDQLLVRAGFRALLDAQPDIEVVGEADDGEAALRMATDLTPDVVLMDIRMPGMDGLEATRRIAQDRRLDRTRIVILTFDVDDYVFEALRVGASGFLVKDTEPDVLLQGVRAVARGDALLSPGVTRRLIGAFASGQSSSFPSGSTGDRILATVMFSDIVSSTERAARSGTAGGETSSTARMTSSAGSLSRTGAGRSRRPVTASSRCSMPPPGRSGARWQSGTRSDPLGSMCGSDCTAVRSSSEGTTSAGSP
jgi:DNA-binding NarL/FixJ family response regulator